RAALGRGCQQRLALLERELRRCLVLRNLRVLLLVGDVRAVATVQDLNAGFREVANQAVRVRDLLFGDELERALERDRVRVVAAYRHELVAVSDVRTETADVRRHGLAFLRGAELARQLEQIERAVERD